MTAPRRPGAPEPANLDDVQATDRLLSRLGARTPGPGDLDDPVFGALHALAREVDHEEPGADDESMRRLLDALGGRPLYVLDGEDVLDLDAGADLVLIDDPSWEDEQRSSRVVDLTVPVVAGEPEPAEELAETPAAVEQPAPERPAAAARVTELRPPARPGLAGKLDAARPGGGWQAAARKLSLPVAAGIAVFALGGGITSALTGNPIAPVTGIIGAVSGQDDGSGDRIILASVEEKLVQARQASDDQDYETSRVLFAQARDLLVTVDDPAQARMAQQRFVRATQAVPQEALPADVSLPLVPPSAGGGAAVPAPSAAATQAPQPTPSATGTAPVVPTPTVPEPTPDPTQSSPAPTESPDTPAPSAAASPGAAETP